MPLINMLMLSPPCPCKTGSYILPVRQVWEHIGIASSPHNYYNYLTLLYFCKQSVYQGCMPQSILCHQVYSCCHLFLLCYIPSIDANTQVAKETASAHANIIIITPEILDIVMLSPRSSLCSDNQAYSSCSVLFPQAFPLV